MTTRPLVGVIACRREVEGHAAQMVTVKYLGALREYGLNPVILPVWSDQENDHEAARELLSRVDGLVLTGSYSNVEAHRYGAKRAPQNTRDDRDRDAAALTWIHEALDLALPLFGICRGFQELNVAFGGSLHQAVQAVPGMLDHREPGGTDKAAQYAPAHELDIRADGALARLFGDTRTRVNSLHQQGIKRLGEGLVAEAWAPDGLIEAVSVANAASFALAVQWHPEWQPCEHALHDALFRGFAEACRAHRGAVHPPSTTQLA
ncbi:gamma-glutamyl-gamma-aminobutyrate hydrolase family protein [Billgrantia montanilacus]|uniref:gamma-glutamyl-gamma-aminobutyrate hydrolase n=1 Tax=Billgrantia montanilacus TaxID=2282305 RepID=A0A368U2U9_9GAMM|nr:gamma-glutamyl-gamma-aminobutyrate hydrolase family protein [Halomonas montanilacus]RCV91151.1 gamma-glutamyl-gamma-aminobutyrate hydrolase family protein [Halomonas montanilacus]